MAPVTNRVGILLAEKERKEKRRITDKEIAEATNVSPGAIANWRFNRVTRFDSDQIIAFCRYFDVTINELLVLPDASNENPKFGQEVFAATAA